MIRAIAHFFALHIVWVEIFCRGFSFACVSSQFVNPRSVVILFVVDMTSCFSSVVALWYAVASDLIHLPSPPWDFPAGHLWGHRRVYTLNYTTSIPLDIAMEYAITPLSLVCMCFLMVIFRPFLDREPAKISILPCHGQAEFCHGQLEGFRERCHHI